MQRENEVQQVFLVGAKSLGAYGGYETFVYKLTAVSYTHLGFGTFGTNISYKNQSQLYNIYNSLNYSHLMNYEMCIRDRIFTEKEINISGIQSKTSKQGIATIEVFFNIRGRDPVSYTHLDVYKRQVICTYQLT